MIKLVKIVGSTLLALILLAILGSILFVTFVSPNQFKPLITEQVKKFTGRQLTIDGNLSWTFYPNLGVKVGHMQLSNPSEFTQKIFAEIQSATLGVKVMPLFHARVESNGISLHGMKLYLIKNAKGKTNWQDLKSTSDSKPQSSQENKTTTIEKISLGLAVSNLDISDAEINWIDTQAKKSFSIEKFELHAKNINLSQPFPIESAFKFSGTQPDIAGKVNLTSNILLNWNEQVFSFNNLDLLAKIHQDKKYFETKIKGNLVANTREQTLQINNLVGQVANLTLTGEVNTTQLLSEPKTIGHVEVQPFDVKKWLQNTKQDVASLQELKDVSGRMDFSLKGKTVILTGDWQADEMLTNKLKITNIRAKTQMQNGVFTIPMTADFYQGTLQAQTNVNLNAEIPKLTMQAKVNNVQAEPLFTDLAGDKKIKITGLGSIDLQLSTLLGTDTVLKSLNGIGHVNFNDGVVKGIDIGYLIDNANAMAHGKSLSRNDSGQTGFGTLTGTFTIRDGVMTNNDLYLNSPRFDIKGAGTINLVNQTINYKLNTSAKKIPVQSDDLKTLYGITIPIAVVGDLSNPSIRLDAGSFMKVIASQQLEKAKTKIQERIEKKIKGKIPEEASQLLNTLLGQ